MFNFLKSNTLNNNIIIVITLLVTILCGYGASSLHFRGDYKVFFEPNNSQRLAYEKMQKIFTKNESVSIVIFNKKGDLFNERSIKIIQEITELSKQVPKSTRIDSIVNFQHTYSDYDDLIIEDLLYSEQKIDDDVINKIKLVALNEQELVNKLISEDGRASMVNINVILPDGDQTLAVHEIGDHVRGFISDYIDKYPDHRFELSGVVMMTDGMFISAMNDASKLFPIMFLVISLLMIFLLGSFKASVSTLIIVTISIVSTLGIAGWLGIPLSIATVNVPIIVMTLAIADSVHIISSMRFYMESGYKKDEAIIKSLYLNYAPIIITSLTTAIGFLTLNFSKVPILNDLGNLVAIGVVFACLYSLIFLPVILNKFNIDFKKIENKKDSQILNWHKLNEFIKNNNNKILFVSLVLIVFSSIFASKNVLNDIGVKYFNIGSEFRTAADFHEEKISGLSNVDLAIYTNKDNGINSIEFLNVVDDFVSWLELQPEVDHVFSYTNTLKRLNKNLNSDNDDFFKIPESKELSAQYLLLYEMSLPYGLDLNNQIDINKSALRIMVTLKNLGSIEFTDFENRAKDWIKKEAPEYELEAGSLALIFAHIGKINMQSMLVGAFVALILISILLIFSLRSVKLGLISLVPNLLPALFGFGIWFFLSGQINMALSVVLTITMGIIVDDTVHFLSKYKKALNMGMNIDDALLFTYNNVGNALFITTVILASGFGVLAFSDFAINSDMGLLTAIIITLALIIDLFILPSIIRLFKKLR